MKLVGREGDMFETRSLSFGFCAASIADLLSGGMNRAPTSCAGGNYFRRGSMCADRMTVQKIQQRHQRAVAIPERHMSRLPMPVVLLKSAWTPMAVLSRN
jgi:hypothetical protein